MTNPSSPQPSISEGSVKQSAAASSPASDDDLASSTTLDVSDSAATSRPDIEVTMFRMHERHSESSSFKHRTQLPTDLIRLCEAALYAISECLLRAHIERTAFTFALQTENDVQTAHLLNMVDHPWVGEPLWHGAVLQLRPLAVIDAALYANMIHPDDIGFYRDRFIPRDELELSDLSSVRLLIGRGPDLPFANYLDVLIRADRGSSELDVLRDILPDEKAQVGSHEVTRRVVDVLGVLGTDTVEYRERVRSYEDANLMGLHTLCSNNQ